jgi:large subunit ribosomal protein L13
MKSYHAKEKETKRQWLVIDLKDKILGRMATQIADILRGKNKPTFTPSADTGDFVIAINSDHLKLTGRKLDQKKYYHHTGYFGGIKHITAKDQLKKDSTELVYNAVKGMLPKGPLGRKQIKKLKVYATAEHPHAAQQPVEKA